MPANRRKGGACVQCVRRKRKCDHKKPHCSECLKHNVACQPRIFKSWARSPANAASGAAETWSANRDFEDDDSTLSQSQSAPPCPISEPVIASTMVLAEVDAVPGAEIVPSSLSSSASLESDPHGFFLDSPMIGTVNGLSDYSLLETQDMTKSILTTTTTNINPDMVTFATPLPAFLSMEPTLPYCPSLWPDDLQASPKRQFLWNYFLHSLQMNALCLDLEDMPGFQDPFIATIPQMALRNATLREAALCFSAFQYTALHGHWDLNRTMGAAWRKAYEGLRAQLAIRQAADGWGFLSMISACCLLYWCTADQGEDCLRLATKLAMEFLQQQQVEPSIPCTYQDVILTGFRWTMIATLCSLKPPSRLLNDKIIDAVEMGHHEVDANHSPAFANWISHPLYAFSPRLVNPLLRMGHLAETQLLRRKDKIHGSKDSTTDQFEHELLAVEETLLQAREADLMATIAPGCFTNPSFLASLNEAMHAASFILFYTRFRGLPFTAPVIRRQVRTVVSEISKIHENSRVSYAIVFPLFIAACEAVDQEDRQIIENRLRMPRGLFVDRGNTTAALRHIWEIRDLQPGLSWPDWVSKGMNILVSAHRRDHHIYFG